MRMDRGGIEPQKLNDDSAHSTSCTRPVSATREEIIAHYDQIKKTPLREPWDPVQLLVS
jgi:hypothetical protein